MAHDGKYVAVYDVSDHKERTKVRKVLEGYGFRVQKSVFECRLTRGMKRRLIKSIESLDLQTGSVFIYRINDHSKTARIGKLFTELKDNDYAFIV